MSNEREFFDRSKEMMDYYNRGDYAVALSVTERIAAEFPSQSIRTDFWRICLLSRMQKIDDALRVFKNALEAGMWWSEPTLRNDSDLEPLQGLPEFERMVAVCRERHAAARVESKPALIVREPAKAAKPYPLLIALHPMSSNADAYLDDWAIACKTGWLVAAVQSSQLSWPGAFAWTDREKAQEEVVGQFANLCEQYPVDRSRVIISGMSQGGALAIRITLSGSIPALGFLAVVPGKIEQPLLEEWASVRRGFPLRGYIVAGGRDPRYEFFKQLCELLPQRGIPCRMEDHRDMGHEFPPDFEKTLNVALKYFLTKEQE